MDETIAFVWSNYDDSLHIMVADDPDWDVAMCGERPTRTGTDWVIPSEPMPYSALCLDCATSLGHHAQEQKRRGRTA